MLLADALEIFLHQLHLPLGGDLLVSKRQEDKLDYQSKDDNSNADVGTRHEARNEHQGVKERLVEDCGEDGRNHKFCAVSRRLSKLRVTAFGAAALGTTMINLDRKPFAPFESPPFYRSSAPCTAGTFAKTVTFLTFPGLWLICY